MLSFFFPILSKMNKSMKRAIATYNNLYGMTRDADDDNMGYHHDDATERRVDEHEDTEPVDEHEDDEPVDE